MNQIPNEFRVTRLAVHAYRRGWEHGQKRAALLLSDKAESVVIPPEFIGHELASDAYVMGEIEGYMSLIGDVDQIFEAERIMDEIEGAR